MHIVDIILEYTSSTHGIMDSAGEVVLTSLSNRNSMSEREGERERRERERERENSFKS
jgi:hypothetical protein